MRNWWRTLHTCRGGRLGSIARGAMAPCARLCAVLLPLLAASAGAIDGGGGGGPGRASADEIAALIVQLGDSSYERRLDATRRLCAIGTGAVPQLEEAQKSDAAEIGLRAQRILSILEELWFVGVDVTLSFSRSTVGWNEGTALRITFTNRSTVRTRLPFTIDADGTDDPPGPTEHDADARQVGRMLDVADFLVVSRPGGGDVELRVDDISVEPAVMGAVQERLAGLALGFVEAEQRIEIVVPDFNRGWARYPLLDEGLYEVAFRYAPQWNDAALDTSRVGWVQSAPVTLTVTNSAPALVSRVGEEASVRLERNGEELVARLINHSDQSTFVNANFGQGAPFADGAWVYAKGDATKESSLSSKPPPAWSAFQAERLVQVAAGDSIELARVRIPELRQRFADLGADVNVERWAVHFSYASLTDRLWQSRQGAALFGDERAPKVLRDPLPRRMLATRLSSGRLVSPFGD